MVAHVEIPDRIEIEDSAARRRRRRDSDAELSWTHRLTPARLTSRIVLLNIAGLIVLVSGILYLQPVPPGPHRRARAEPDAAGPYHRRGGRRPATVDTGSIVIDPDALIEARRTIAAPDARATSPRSRFSHQSRKCRPMLRRLLASTTSAPASIDPDGNLVVDAAISMAAARYPRRELPPLDASRGQGSAQAGGSRFNDWLFTNDYPLQKEYGLDNGKDFPRSDGRA